MGYCMEQIDSNFKIKKENKKKLFKKVINHFKSLNNSNKKFKWIDNENVLDSENIFELFESLRYEVEYDIDDNIKSIDFIGEKLGDDYEVFELIAEFVEKDSYIIFKGEDDEIFEFTFIKNEEGNMIVEEECHGDSLALLKLVKEFRRTIE